MLLPTSRKQIEKLGQRLKADAAISADDDRRLEDLVACHQHALALTRPRLDGLAQAVGTPARLHIGARAKGTLTIIEKLRREHSASLATMVDLAGFRIVGAFDFATQDRLYEEIAQRFPADPRAPKPIDRREHPSHGYRALHAAVSYDGVSIEIQIRTVYQHIWANLMEKFADRLGRQIRYGEPPVPPPGMSQGDADSIVAMMHSMAMAWSSREAWPNPDVDAEAVSEELWSGLREDLRKAGLEI